MHSFAYLLKDFVNSAQNESKAKELNLEIRESVDSGKRSKDFANKLKVAVKPFLGKYAKGLDPKLKEALYLH